MSTNRDHAGGGAGGALAPTLPLPKTPTISDGISDGTLVTQICHLPHKQGLVI